MTKSNKAAPARVWRNGPPPHVGWWNARVTTVGCASTEKTWGWWDGQAWSVFSDDYSTPAGAGLRAMLCGADGGSTAHVEWTDHYPADARVPRLNPAEGWVLNEGMKPDHLGDVEVAFFNGGRDGWPDTSWWSWHLPPVARPSDIYAWRPAP